MSNFTYLDAITYTYAVFSVLTDGDYDEKEIQEVFQIAQEWASNESPETIANSMNKTVALFTEDLAEGVVFDRLGSIVGVLNEMFNDENKKAFIADLVRIGKADGDYDENEKAMVEKFKELFGV